ncbi:MAG: tryptophan-rich sensory protein [Chloroflexota bacterium]|nr:tryptophan-rich sensory protein [Chloroflexota bacterium]
MQTTPDRQQTQQAAKDGLAPVARPDSSPARSRRVDTGSEWFWPVVNLVGLVVVITVNVLANVMEFNGLTTSEVVNHDPVYFQPAGWAFSIWSVIYVLLAVFVAYTFLSVGRENSRMRKISPIFLVSNIANALWIVFWHWEQWDLTLATMAVLLVSLILLYYLLRRRRGIATQPATIERLMVWTPFSVYLAWVSVATLSNVAVWSDRTGADIWGMDGRWTAVIFLLGLVAATALMALWLRDPTYAVVIIWAAAGITLEQWDRSKLVSIAAGLTVVLATALAVFGSLLAFEQRQRGRVLPSAAAADDHHRRFWQRPRT